MEDRYHKVLYAEPPGYLQFWKRWWYGEDKNKTFHHLDIYFTNFMKFLDKIIKKTDMNRSIEMTKLSNDICVYINNIIPGIYSLKDTYPSYKKLHCKVDSIILTLIDFKGEVRKKNKKPNYKVPPKSRNIIINHNYYIFIVFVVFVAFGYGVVCHHAFCETCGVCAARLLVCP